MYQNYKDKRSNNVKKKDPNFNRLLVEIEMEQDELAWDESDKLWTVFFTIWVKRGKNPASDMVIDDIYVGYQQYDQTSSQSKKFATDWLGKFEFEAQLNPQFKKVRIAVTIAGKRYQQFFDIPPTPNAEAGKKAKKAGWFEVRIGDPGKDGQSHGKIIVKESKDGPLTIGKMRISSDRPFAIADNSVIADSEQKLADKLTINGEMLIEVEISRDPNHRQQHLYFTLEETGESREIFLVK